MAYVSIIIIMCIKLLKEELAWATDKWLQVIDNGNYFDFKTMLYTLLYVVFSNV